MAQADRNNELMNLKIWLKSAPPGPQSRLNLQAGLRMGNVLEQLAFHALDNYGLDNRQVSNSV